jgi:acid phosphatase family membrane protein YuiD
MSEVPIYLVIPLVAWIVAQLVKQVIGLMQGRKDFLGGFFRSGNMPSGHAAGVAALLSALGVREGIESAIFGVAAIMSAIILYDAVHVRRAVGEQGRILRLLAKEQTFFAAEGHRIIEVLVGLLLGAIVAVLMLQIL